MLKDVRTDEASAEDRLNRQQFAQAFARLGENCQTPLVVGIFGTWGVGKTSFMRLIEANLDQEKALPLWFDPWMHQFDENPVVALAHTLVNALDPKWLQEGKKLLVAIANAFGSALLKVVTGLKPQDIYDFQKIYEEEGFLARDVRVRLRDYFEKLVEMAREGKSLRLVFFIDDLDRCLPEEALKVLEALKLYLNLEGCVYFLGVDREALEHCIKHRYQDLPLSGVDYLDKMVQLPFYLPVIDPEQMGGFVDELLPSDLKECREILVQCLGHNPRQVKRFINNLVLHHYLAREPGIPDYRPRVLALLLLLQLLTPPLYRRVAAHPEVLEQLRQEDATAGSLTDILSRNEGLFQTIKEVEAPDAAGLQRYIYLTRAAGMQPTTPTKPGGLDLRWILQRHRKWLTSSHTSNLGDILRDALRDDPIRADPSPADLGRADLTRADLSRANLSRADLTRADLSLADLNRADLSLAVLDGADLSGAYLMGANLKEASLLSADLRKADLTGADLTRADLFDANLSGANLSGANLSEACLLEADLRKSDLTGADLTRADLTRADLCGANLSDAKITKEQIFEALIDENTILPENLRTDSD